VITDTPAFQILNEAMKGMKQCISIKAQIPWYDIPFERENYQPPKYVDYNLFPLNIYEYQLKGMKHVVIYLTTYSFHGHQKFTNSCN
jgi:hypothetical protein